MNCLKLLTVMYEYLLLKLLVEFDLMSYDDGTVLLKLIYEYLLDFYFAPLGMLTESLHSLYVVSYINN